MAGAQMLHVLLLCRPWKVPCVSGGSLQHCFSWVREEGAGRYLCLGPVVLIETLRPLLGVT